MWVAGTQVLEPSLLPPRVCLSRKLDQKRSWGWIFECTHTSVSVRKTQQRQEEEAGKRRRPLECLALPRTRTASPCAGLHGPSAVWTGMPLAAQKQCRELGKHGQTSVPLVSWSPSASPGAGSKVLRETSCGAGVPLPAAGACFLAPPAPAGTAGLPGRRRALPTRAAGSFNFSVKFPASCLLSPGCLVPPAKSCSAEGREMDCFTQAFAQDC